MRLTPPRAPAAASKAAAAALEFGRGSVLLAPMSRPENTIGAARACLALPNTKASAATTAHAKESRFIPHTPGVWVGRAACNTASLSEGHAVSPGATVTQ